MALAVPVIVAIPQKRGRKVTAPPAETDAKSEPEVKSAIVTTTTTSRKRVKLLRAARVTESDDDPEATARVKAFLARMVRTGGALPPDTSE